MYLNLYRKQFGLIVISFFPCLPILHCIKFTAIIYGSGFTEKFKYFSIERLTVLAVHLCWAYPVHASIHLKGSLTTKVSSLALVVVLI